MNPLGLTEQTLKEKFPGCHVEVTDLTGTQDHLGILIVHDSFAQLMTFKQHQLVMAALSELLKGPVHAVKLKTMTFQQFGGTP